MTTFRTTFQRCLYLLSLLMLPMAAMAQFQLPDPGFEDWSGDKFANVAQPKYWHYSNVNQFTFDFNFSHPNTPGRNGGLCLYVEDQAMKVIGIDGGTSPGYAALGHPWAYVPGLDKISGSTAGTIGGIEFSQRPDTVALWIKRTGKNWDKENYNILFYLWKGTARGTSYPSDAGCTNIERIDEESDIRIALDANSCGTVTAGEEIGEALWFERKLINEWTQIKVPIFYMSSEIPEKCNLILSAGNYPAGKSTAGFFAGNGLYVDDVELIYASSIQKLYVGNKEWKGFDPNSTEVQTYSLGTGATTIPEIYAVRGVGKETNCNGESYNFAGRRLDKKEMTIVNGKVDGEPTTITVRAADGSSETTYRIQFVSKASTNARLASIEVNGQALDDFNGYINDYSYSLPYKTTATPVVTASAQDANATIEITQPTDVNGRAVINVTAQDGKATQSYSVQFSVAPLSDVTLKDILVDGQSLEGFSPNKTSYTLRLPVEQTTVPTITPVSAYDEGEQTIRILSNTLSGGCQIQVSIPGTELSKTYKITYKQEASSNRYLQSLMLDGIEISGWNPAKSAYSILLPQGTKTAPAITYIAGDNEQVITVTENGLNATSTVRVVAGNGDTWTYTIQIRVEQSDNASLKMIYLNGEPLENFDPATLVYKHILDSLPAPTISVDKGDSLQQVLIVQASGYGRAQISVAAEAGNTQTYIVRFIRADEVEPVIPDAPVDTLPLNSDARLKAIYLNGTSLSGFDPDQYEYVVDSLTSLPTLSIETIEAVSNVAIYTASLDAYSTIVVTSRDGLHQATYRLLLRALRTNDATLEELSVETYGIDFDPAVTHYTVTLPKGASYPDCSYRRANDLQTVRTITTTDCKHRVVRYQVMSADSTVSNEYVIEMGEAQITLPNVLKSIIVEGYGALDLTGGATSWDIPLAWGTKDIHIQYVKNYAEQVVLVAEGGPVLPTVITVISGKEGEENTTYTLRPVMATEGDPATLKNLMANGTTLPNFSPNIYSYVMSISTLPTITWEKYNKDTEVDIIESDIKHTAIHVSHELDEHVYTIYYFYPSDVIPTDFTNWVPTKYNNAQKPFGWTAPADVIQKSSAGNYNTGGEVRPSRGSAEGRYPDASEGNETVNLNTAYFTNFGSYNPVPAILTLGRLQMNLPGWGQNSASVEGGIAFRNTPDSITIDFKPITANNMDHGLIEFHRFTDGVWNIQSSDIPYDTKGTWQHAAQPISWTDGLSDSINIVFNGADRYNGFGGLAGQQQNGELRIRNLRILYNSNIDHLLVNGQNIAAAPTMSLTLASAEVVGIPTTQVFGQVADQQPVLTWSSEVNRQRTLQIRNIAEDGSYSDYTLEVTRPVSTLCDTAYVQRNGNDIIAAAVSPYATIAFARTDSSYQIIVTAENGDKKTFECPTALCIETIDTTIVRPFVQPQDTLSADTTTYPLSNVSTLQMITIAGTDYAGFIPGGFDYEIFTQDSVLGYRKMEDCQHVYHKQITTAMIHYHYLYVYAENGQMSTYVIRLNHKEVSSDASLKAILVNGENIPSFAPGQYYYQVELPAGSAVPSVLAQTNHEEANVQESKQTTQVGNTTVITYTFIVTAEDGVTQTTYTVVVLIAAKPSSLLDMIYINGDSIDNFQPEVFAYTYKFAMGESLLNATVDKGESDQQVETRIEADTVRFIVTATDLSQSVYTITLQYTPSSDCDLKMIYVNGEAVTDFRADEDSEYHILLPNGTTTLPVITWALGEEHQTVSADSTGTLETTYRYTITVTSQDGENTRTYELIIANDRSHEARLSDLLIRGVSVAGFQSDLLEYTITHPKGTTEADFIPVADIVPVPMDSKATVTIQAISTSEFLIQVLAEDQKTRMNYVLYQEVELSDNALLSDLIVNGTTIDGFAPTVFNYLYKAENTGSVALAADFIDAVPMDSNADVWITWPDMDKRNMQVGDTLVVHCLAEDGLTEHTYSIVVVFGPEKSLDPNTQSCLLVQIPGTATFKAVAIRNNIHCMLYTASGQIIWNSTAIDKIGIPVADPMHVTVLKDEYGNDQLVAADDRARGAVTCELPKAQVCFAVFFTDNNGRKQRIGKGQKIMVR